MPLRSLPPAKKRKTVSLDGTSSKTIEQVATLEKQLTDSVQSGGSLNALADLVTLTRTSSASVVATSKAIYTLYRVYVILLSSGKLSPAGDEAAKTARAWIWDRLNAYTDILCGLLQDQDKGLRTSALQILFSLLKHLSSFLSSQTPSSPQFHAVHFRKIVSAFLLCPPSYRSASAASEKDESPTKKRKLSPEEPAPGAELDPDVREQFTETWLTVHDDVRWFFLRESATIVQNEPTSTHPYVAANLLSLLEQLNTFPTDLKELNEWWVPELGAKPKGKKKTVVDNEEDEEEEEAPEAGGVDDEDDWRKFFDEEEKPKVGAQTKAPAKTRRPTNLHASLHSLAAHRAVFTRCWLALLPRITTTPLTSRALAIFHRLVLPHLTRPVLVADWVGEAVDKGGATGLLALNTLFLLMTSYNLDYPSFYNKLYAFLDRNVLHVVHRARFFRIAEKCLSSTHLPATLLASFVKRLARLSLSAPPAALVAVVPFTYNLLKKNPALMVMIHRPSDSTSFVDPFDPLELDPLKTRALDSSLWELRGATAKHFHPAVSTLFKVLEAPFTKPSYQLEDFVDHSYSTMFETEVKKRMRQDPVVVEEKLTGELFPRRTEAQEEESIKVDAVAELWSFGA